MAATGGCFVLAALLFLSLCDSLEVDKKGYILYCPCMGRFGNQADHFLGALAFAKAVDRTLVLPPWVEYHHGQPQSVQVAFDKYFKVEPLREYHQVMTMEEFMKELAPTIWPVGDRIATCYSDYKGDGVCRMKEGNPFKSFWDTFNIDFDGAEFYAPLYFDTHEKRNAIGWKERFPPSKFPVLAFPGAPAAFPVAEWNVRLHKYLQWSDDVQLRADEFIKFHLDGGPFIGIHLRNGTDFKNACGHLTAGHHLFATPQCLGYNFEHGQITHDLCYPSEDIAFNHVKKVVEETKIKTVFIATDNPHLVKMLIKRLDHERLKVMRQFRGDPLLDLAILGRSAHFIANCASSYSAFAVRDRLVNGEKPTSFLGFPTYNHEEL